MTHDSHPGTFGHADLRTLPAPRRVPLPRLRGLLAAGRLRLRDRMRPRRRRRRVRLVPGLRRGHGVGVSAAATRIRVARWHDQGGREAGAAVEAEVADCVIILDHILAMVRGPALVEAVEAKVRADVGKLARRRAALSGP